MPFWKRDQVKPKIVGLSDFHYAIMIADEEGNISYREVKPMKGARGINVTAVTSGDPYYEDDTMTGSFETVTGATVEITISSLMPQEYADLMGQPMANGIIVDNLLADSPYVAIGYKRLLTQDKEDGSPAYRYIWLFKGKFGIPDESGTTMEGQRTPQEPVLRGTFMPLQGMIADGTGRKGKFWRAQGGDEFDDWTTAKEEAWFKTVQGISPAPTIVPDPVTPDPGP